MINRMAQLHMSWSYRNLLRLQQNWKPIRPEWKTLKFWRFSEVTIKVVCSVYHLWIFPTFFGVCSEILIQFSKERKSELIPAQNWLKQWNSAASFIQFCHIPHIIITHLVEFIQNDYSITVGNSGDGINPPLIDMSIAADVLIYTNLLFISGMFWGPRSQ